MLVCRSVTCSKCSLERAKAYSWIEPFLTDICEGHSQIEAILAVRNCPLCLIKSDTNHIACKAIQILVPMYEFPRSDMMRHSP